MNIAYGSAVQNAFKAILYYEIEETDTTYKVTFKYGGSCPYSSRYIAIAENRTITEQTVLTFDGRQLHNRTVNHTNYSADTVLIMPDGSEYYGLSIDVSQIIAKTAEAQTIPVVFTDTLSSFCRYDGSTGSRSSYFGQSTSTLTMTLTVPALAKPTVTATARRDETVDTTVLFDIAVKSFRYDSISTIKVLINGELTEVNGGSIGSSLVINRSASVEGNSQGPLTCSVIAVGRGGESAEYPITVPSSFFTMDIGGKGKSIAFGEPAPDSDLPDNGQFVCAMDAEFKNRLLIKGQNVADYVIEQGTTSTGWEYRKWSSGKCEAWRTYTRSVTVNTAWGGIYRTGAYTLGVPNVFNSPPQIYATSKGTACWVICCSDAQPGTDFTFYVANGISLSAANRTFSFYMNGTWK